MTSSADDLSPVKRALLELRNMRARLEASERTRTEPVAIVGMGIRLPGGISTCDAFWTLLSEGRDAITEVPVGRWDVDGFHDPDPDAAGRISTRFGGFLDRIDEFDARFFGITPREAASMDPQQRLLLEVAWEALEHAGQAPDALSGQAVGVFVGLSSTDYLTTEIKFADAADIDAYIATGGHPSVASGRLSYLLGLEGPSLTVDTACSSSLTAVHLAAQSLRLGECRMALAGGVSLLLLPELSINFSRAHMMAADGRCKTFDARADGYVRSEGCGVLVLKRLSDAVAANDRILAVIRGSALNQDGRSSGLTVPNGPAQEAVIREALRRAGVAPAEVDYVEAHGTGTSLGDPVELRALGGVFSAGREAGKKLTVGSVKTNLGHLEAAAGVAGIVKVVLALQHGAIPAHLHFQQPTPHVDWAALPLQVPSSAIPWGRGERLRTAGVSSFGFSGTNAHVVIADAPAVEPRAASGPGRPLHLLTVSGKTPEALHDAALRLADRVAIGGDALADICYTANSGRAHFAERAAIVAASLEEAGEALAAVAGGTESSRVVRASLGAGRRPEVAFLFAGYGSQYAGMGRELFETQPAFRRTLLTCEELLRPHLERPLTAVLYPAPGESSPIDEPAYGQPALFAFEYALAELWRSWGVQPTFVLGHSLGEDAAACVAGVFDLERGIEMVARRARLMQRCMAEGAMAAIFATPDAVRAALAGGPPDLAIAAINGPQHVVISGPREAVTSAVERFQKDGVKVRALSAPRGCHSILMDPVLDRFEALAAEMNLADPRLGFVSTLTGRLTASGELTDPGYWRRHVRETVRFSDALDALYEQGARVLLEIGPRDTLTSMGRRSLVAPDVTWVQSLDRNGADWAHVLPALATLYASGVPVRWDAFDAEYPRRKVELPAYPFQRERHWSDAVRPRVPADSGKDAGEAVDEWLHTVTWHPAPLADAPRAAASDTGHRAWVVFEDGGGLGARLVEELRADGRRTVLIRASELNARRENETDDALAGRIAQLLRERADGGIEAVVHMGTLDAPHVDALGAEDVLQAVVDASGSVLHALQAIGTIGQAGAPRLWIVTRGAEATGSGNVDAVQSPVTALAATIDSEHPELRCTCVDIDPGSEGAGDPVAQLWREVTGNGGRERRVAWRAGERWVARITRARSLPAAPIAIRRDVTYLITGGAGALGLVAARWLAGAGARHLVLTGRSGARGSAAAAVDAIKAMGCNVHVASGDVADETFVSDLIARVRETLPPVAGVIHAAGVLDDGVLLQQTTGRLAGVMRPKVAGAWNLHRATSGLPLDFFALFSSAAALLGTGGQGNYAAANAFMDGLAHQRRRAGLTAISINWAGWSETGMAAATDPDRRGRSARGLSSIGPRQGVEVLARLAASPAAHVAVLPIDWNAYLGGRADRPALFDGLAAVEPSAPAPIGGLAASWRALPEAGRRAAIEAHVREQILSVIGLDAGERLDPRQGLVDLGIDSLMTLELRNRLQRSTGEALPATLVFDHPSIEALTSYLEREIIGARAAATAEPRPAVKPASTKPVPSQDIPSDAIAIVGIGCRMPGGVVSPESFWTLLREGVDAVSEVPADRWNADAYYDPDPDSPGKMVTRWGGFVEDVDRFDPQFFGIAPREAAGMDPQQRLLLEVSWEALEHAGQAPDRLHGSNTGVFVGISTNEYLQLQIKAGASRLDAHAGTGGAVSVAAGRLSYSLGLQGPALAVDTACSSSLVAVHLACQSLQRGECDMALAGGVNLTLAPEANVILSRARMLSPEGRCKTFDASADGYVRGEGCGVIVLKRLAEAEQAGDRVLAVIRATAVNQDGRSGGLTVPNGPAQEALIRKALASAGVSPAQVDYVEAHGTGTPLGDPIEVRALGNVFGDGRAAADPLLIGSVKTNVGHLESAAGIAGLIKVALSLHRGEIPAHLHLESLNPLIALDAIPAAIPTSTMPWPARGTRRLAGVSSFGFSGTNAHAVLEAAPSRAVKTGGIDRQRHVLALSAKTPDALRELARRYQERLADAASNIAAGDVCFTANAGRSHFEHRLAVTGTTIADLRHALAARAASIVEVDAPLAPRIAFMFTGQGSQHAGMGRELYETQPVFASALARCDEIYRDATGESLLDAIYPAADDDARINETAVAQPALFAIEYSLAELWRSWGVAPSAVIGHSVGEIVAACVAGAMSLEDGLKLTIARGRLMQSLPAGGAMAAVMATEADVRSVLVSHGGELSIAAINSPENVVISGPEAVVGSVCERFAARGIQTRRLVVSHAFHSTLMEPILDAFERAAEGVAAARPRVAVVSNVTGRMMAPEERLDAAYWRAHARQPVRFADGIRALAADGCTVFIEIGPSATLSSLGAAAIQDSAAHWVPTLRRGRRDWDQIAESVARLYEAGVRIDWEGFDKPYARRKVTLPTYAFQRERCWLDEDAGVASEAAGSRWADSGVYEVAWRRSAGPSETGLRADGRSLDASGRWIVLAEDGGSLGVDIARVLTARGGECAIAYAGRETRRDGDGRWTIDLSAPNGFDPLIADSAARLRGVVHCLSLDARPLEDATAATLAQAGLLTCGSLLHLTQALSRAGSGARVWVVTKDAVAAVPQDTLRGVTQTPAWGFGRVLSLEHPELWGGLIDISAGQFDAVALIVDRVLGPDADDQMALRRDGCFVPRLVAAAPAVTNVRLRRDASYLITGGMGGVGLLVAGDMARQGAGHLLLVSRSGMPPRERWPELPADSEAFRQAAAIAAIEALGTAVTVVAADIGSPDAQPVLSAALADAPPLRGVVHAAAVISARRTEDLALRDVERMLHPKLAGTLLLERAVSGCDLDFFVLFSSTAAVLGAAELSHYAAANAFLDGFARVRRSEGTPAISIGWGAWERIRGSAEQHQAIDRGGMKIMPAARTLDALTHLRGADASHVVFAEVDWPTLTQVYETRRQRPLFDEVRRQAPALAHSRALAHGRPATAHGSSAPAYAGPTFRSGASAEASNELLARIEAARPAERRAVLLAHIRDLAAAVLGVRPGQIDPRRGLFDMGMDSLMSVDLKTKLENTLGQKMPSTLTFNYPSVDAITDFVAGFIPGMDTPPAPLDTAAAGAPSSTADRDDDLSEDELAAMLADRLNRMPS